MNELTIKQPLIIEYSHLEAEGRKVDERLAALKLNELVATEETVKDLKVVRADLNKVFNDYEGARKAIKEVCMQPYKEFEEAYKLHITDKFKPADELLKTKINDVDNGIRANKEIKIIEYFASQLTPEIDFLTFDKTGISVKLSDSEKALKTQVDDVVTKVRSDVGMIKSMPYGERILAKYIITLDLHGSVEALNRELEIEQIQAEKATETANVMCDSPAVICDASPQTPAGPGMVQGYHDEVLEIGFVVKASRIALRRLREYMDANCIEWRNSTT